MQDRGAFVLLVLEPAQLHGGVREVLVLLFAMVDVVLVLVHKPVLRRVEVVVLLVDLVALEPVAVSVLQLVDLVVLEPAAVVVGNVALYVIIFVDGRARFRAGQGAQ